MELLDAIVLGMGGMGSAACYSLAKRGARVVGLEQFKVGNDRGSSHGESRMIRKAYFEHPNYVPLLEEAYRGWKELENFSGTKLFHETGLVIYGPPDSPIFLGVLKSAAQHSIPIGLWNQGEPPLTAPHIPLPTGSSAIVEPGAGYLKVDACVRAQANSARRLGVKIHEGIRALNWKTEEAGIVVETDQGEFRAHHLIVTAGAWTNEILRDIPVSLKVHRQVSLWFLANGYYEESAGMPCFAFVTPSGFLYGFPQVQGGGVKVADHTPGRVLSHPEEIDRTLHSEDFEKVSQFLAAHAPGIEPVPVRHSTCLYNMARDENFIIDIHPQFSQVVFATGFSGHGFKFCPIVGEILADFALEGKTDYPCEFLRLRPEVM